MRDVLGPAGRRSARRCATRRGALGEQLRAEVGFRGAFTLDGVATADGFRPTELNPRFGAGLGVITRGLADVPLHLVLDLVVGRHRRCRSPPPSWSGRSSTVADAERVGGSWQVGVVAAQRRSTTARCATSTASGAGPPTASPPTRVVTAGDGFTRVNFDPARTPVGPSVGPRAAAFWRFADAELGTDVGPLEAARRRGRGRSPEPASRSSGSEERQKRQMLRPAAVQYSSLRWRL